MGPPTRPPEPRTPEAPPQSSADPRTVKRAVELAFAREARVDEVTQMSAFLEKQATRYPALSAEKLTERVYADFCQVLLSANEFVYVD